MTARAQKREIQWLGSFEHWQSGDRSLMCIIATTPQLNVDIYSPAATTIGTSWSGLRYMNAYLVDIEFLSIRLAGLFVLFRSG